jgi:hypothetical protein
MDEFAVAIAAFNPAFVMRDLQPDAGVAQSAFTAVARDAPCVHDAGFWGLQCHVVVLGFGCAIVMTKPSRQGKGRAMFWVAELYKFVI